MKVCKNHNNDYNCKNCYFNKPVINETIIKVNCIHKELVETNHITYFNEVCNKRYFDQNFIDFFNDCVIKLSKNKQLQSYIKQELNSFDNINDCLKEIFFDEIEQPYVIMNMIMEIEDVFYNALLEEIIKNIKLWNI